jgi:mono/diheme cytochrome c family protein
LRYRIAAVSRKGLLVVPVVLVLAGCGSGTTVRPVAETVVGKTPSAPKQQPVKGDATAGKNVFISTGCGGCHTLKAANSHGNVGPNLDQLKPSLSSATNQIEHGGGGMPAFQGQLSNKQIADVATFVVQSTR